VVRAHLKEHRLETTGLCLTFGGSKERRGDTASLVAGPNRHVLKLRRVTQCKVQMSDWCTVLPRDEVEPVPLMQPRQPKNVANHLDLR
jgi:hypothetical protein